MPSADPLANVTPAVREWFERAFAEPTKAQEQAWPAIAGGEHVVLSAPTGSGKTLAAFLWGLDRLVAEPLPPDERKTRLVYVSPLKALSYDIERNLRAPLQGIGGDISVAIRTGDTPQKERAAMLRKPPDILITTPESLYLLLTSRARENLRGVQTLILDEVHAVAGTKRGAHLALSVERLERLVSGPLQRIGLSATQRPLEEIGRFVAGGRPIELVDAGRAKELDLEIVVPVEDMREPGGGGEDGSAQSIWPSIYPELLRLAHVVERHDDLQVELLRAPRVDELDLAASGDEAPDFLERALGRGQADPLHRLAHEAVEALKAEGEVRAALGAGDRVHLVDDHRVDPAQRLSRARREEQEERLGGRDQDVRRLAQHRRALLLARVAGADAHA